MRDGTGTERAKEDVRQSVRERVTRKMSALDGRTCCVVIHLAVYYYFIVVR